MSPTADNYLREHLDAANAIAWPADPDAKADVAQTLLAIWLIGKCDYWYAHARDRVSNPRPTEPYVRPDSEVAREDASFRSAFSTLDDRQRAAVLRLLRKVIDGTMFGALVTLDQFAHAAVSVTFSNRDGEPPYSVPAVPGPGGFGIHDRWSEWLSRFGDSGPDVT